MTKYKKLHFRKSDHYYIGNRLTAVESMTPSIKRKLDELPLGTIYDDAPEETTLTQRSKQECIFCGQPGTHRKLVYLQMVYLCADDYQNKTTGEIGQKFKETQHAQEEKVQETQNA